jgi:hypothetical protein
LCKPPLDSSHQDESPPEISLPETSPRADEVSGVLFSSQLHATRLVTRDPPRPSLAFTADVSPSCKKKKKKKKKKKSLPIICFFSFVLFTYFPMNKNELPKTFTTILNGQNYVL